MLRGRGGLARILYDMRLLRRRLELLAARLERSAESLELRGAGGDMVRQYRSALERVRYVISALEILEVKLESILALNTVTRDLVVVREALRELSRRVERLPEVSAILDELSDRVSDVVSEIPLDLGGENAATCTEAARRILEEAEALAKAGGGSPRTAGQSPA